MRCARPAISSATPHFFNIVVRKTLRDKKIRIPKKFVKKYGESISSPAILELPSGFAWQVELEISCDGEVWLRNGWPEFVHQLSIRRGHVLVFRYEGNSRFHVIILDTSTTEIDYPINPTLHFDSSQDNDTNEDQVKDPEREDVETSDESVQILDNHFSPLPKKENKSSLHRRPPPPQKRMRAPTVSLSTSSSSSSSALESKVIRRKRRLSPSEESKALKRVKYFASENPFFSIVMKPSHVLNGRSMLTIPKKFAEGHMNAVEGRDFSLGVSDGRSWIVQYRSRIRLDGSNRTIHEIGWNAFADDNNLQVGDVCIFELMSNSIGNDHISLLFQVSIDRHSANDASNSLSIDISESETSSPVCSGKRNNVTSMKRTPSDSCGNDKIPCFQHIVENSKYMYIPARFATIYFGKMRKNQNVKLRVKKRWWDVKVLVSSPRNGHTFSAGWMAFRRDNSLSSGDICRSQMIDKDPIVFQVSITRITSSS